MRANLGAAEDLVSQDLVAEDFGEARHVHTEGYLLYHQGLLQRALRLAKRARATVSFDLGRFLLCFLVLANFLDGFLESRNMRNSRSYFLTLTQN